MENKGPVETSQKAGSTKIMVAVLVVGMFLAVILIYEGGKLERYQQDEKAQMLGQVTQGMISIPGDTRKNILVSPAVSPRVTMSPSVSPITSQNNNPSDSPSIVVVSSPSPSVVLPTSSPSPSTMVTLKNFQPGSVVINEIGWMGTSASYTDEWIELYNPSDKAIDLTGWALKIGDGTKILLQKTINPFGYYLIERTDDSAIRDINADLISSFGKGGLNNEGEKLILEDGAGSIIDLVDCSAGWFSGSNSPKASMERINPANSGNLKENWGTNNGIIKDGFDAKGNVITGTPKAKNSVAVI